MVPFDNCTASTSTTMMPGQGWWQPYQVVVRTYNSYAVVTQGWIDDFARAFAKSRVPLAQLRAWLAELRLVRPQAKPVEGDIVFAQVRRAPRARDIVSRGTFRNFHKIALA